MAQIMTAFNVSIVTLPVAVTASASPSAALPTKGDSIRIVNEGPNVAFVSVGLGAQVATLPAATPTATSTPVAVGDCVLSCNNTDGMQISAICRATQTAQLSVQVGTGA